jgi:HAMP domain-containing protein
VLLLSPPDSHYWLSAGLLWYLPTQRPSNAAVFRSLSRPGANNVALLGGAALYSSIAGTQPLDALATATHEDVNMDVDMDMDMDMDIGGSDVDDVEENYVAVRIVSLAWENIER